MSPSKLTEKHIVERGVHSTEMGSITRFLGWFSVILSLILAFVTFFVVANIAPLTPSESQIQTFFGLNILAIILLALVIGWQMLLLIREHWAGVAGANLNVRIIGLFALVSVIPAGLVALIASVTLDRVLEPWFRGDIKVLIEKTQDVASSFRNDECSGLGALTRLMGEDIEQNKMLIISEDDSFHKGLDRDAFRRFFISRASALGFSMALLINEDGEVMEFFRNPNEDFVLPPSPEEIAETAPSFPETECLIPKNDSFYHMSMKMPGVNNWTLYVVRGVRKHALAFRLAADRGVQSYYQLEEANKDTQEMLETMFFLITLTLLLSTVWVALTFANRLMRPVRRLIQATDQVAVGNYYVQVPVRTSEGDLAHLGETFNKMTSELRLQHDRLVEASNVLDKRRRFTEAVLSGVSAMVIGIDGEDHISIANPSAEDFLQNPEGIIGKPLADVAPQLAVLVQEERQMRFKGAQQIAMVVDGRERILNVRVASELAVSDDGDLVLTIDDITDLVTAQRTSAWADVARRIAHEIKNPLTPIQLSAERIQRKYGKVITEDRDIFDQCTATIVRQVDDIKRMVDEFSSFARMPKPTIDQDDLVDTVRQAVFLTRVGFPEIRFEEHYPEQKILTRFDRRLISQALTNILKNACEAIPESLDSDDSANSSEKKGTISVLMEKSEGHIISIVIDDNGKGFPSSGRQRLLEPYVTTRDSGTGLGLAIVAKIMEEHNGGIELLDNPTGKGGRVRLWLSMESVSQSDKKR